MVPAKHATGQSRSAQGGGVIGFVFGFVLGALISAWLASGAGWLAGLPPILIGFVGARYGDRFWHWFLERLHWFY